MSRFLEIHPDNPQPRLIQHAVTVIRAGGVIAYPTDSCYALGCRLGDKDAATRIRRIRGVDKHHNMTLVCRDLSEIAVYAKVDNATYRLLKAHTPGPYTFILPATHEVPRRLQHVGKKTIGLRVTEHVITTAIACILFQLRLNGRRGRVEISTDAAGNSCFPTGKEDRGPLILVVFGVDLVTGGSPCQVSDVDWVGHQAASTVVELDG